MNLIFDLDGTLIDARERLYRLFQHLVRCSNLSFEDYWHRKRGKVSNETILTGELGYSVDATRQFICEWMELIEAPDFLAFDATIPGVESKLGELREKASLHVCTARQSRERVLIQLDRLELLPYFDNVLVTEQKDEKSELLATLRDLAPNDWILGDTGKDVQTGRALGIRTCAVLTGFLSEASLRPYRPDLVLPSVVNFSLPNGR